MRRACCWRRDARAGGKSGAPGHGMTPVSVVVVSRGRPAALLRCLRALEQQFHPAFEVVVVADAGGAEAVAAAFPQRCKLIRFDSANISVARNLGIAAAAAPIVAFIDDDAAAEPSWLTALAGGFDLPGVAAAAGYVRGRNGISYQWRARELDRAGRSFDAGFPGRNRRGAAAVTGAGAAHRRHQHGLPPPDADRARRLRPGLRLLPRRNRPEPAPCRPWPRHRHRAAGAGASRLRRFGPAPRRPDAARAGRHRRKLGAVPAQACPRRDRNAPGRTA